MAIEEEKTSLILSVNFVVNHDTLSQVVLGWFGFLEWWLGDKNGGMNKNSRNNLKNMDTGYFDWMNTLLNYSGELSEGNGAYERHSGALQ
ncbi:hypothetical protein LIER_08537 [Lithospermum erythrorhizon]|uniref:Uncharacterized protein n=1 Tax=Lithospermum erythrorhizon TaxID=34254 RepID=A0AAV3PGA2_LITER